MSECCKGCTCGEPKPTFAETSAAEVVRAYQILWEGVQPTLPGNEHMEALRVALVDAAMNFVVGRRW